MMIKRGIYFAIKPSRETVWDRTAMRTASLLPVHYTLQWRYNERDGVSNHLLHDCLLNRLSRRRSMKTSKVRVTGLCVGNSLVTGEFPTHRASNAENETFTELLCMAPKIRIPRNWRLSITEIQNSCPCHIHLRLYIAVTSHMLQNMKKLCFSIYHDKDPGGNSQSLLLHWSHTVFLSMNKKFANRGGISCNDIVQSNPDPEIFIYFHDNKINIW